MLKIICCILIVLITTLFGYTYSNKYIKKYEFYKSFLDFNFNLRNKISFSKDTINNIINSLDEKNIFNYYLKNFDKKPDFLTKEEIEEFNSYYQKIGKSDSETQLTYLSSFENILNEKIITTEKDKEKNKSLWTKFGFFIGLIISIAIL